MRHSGYPVISRGHLGCFHSVAVRNNAAIRVHKQALCDCVFSSLGCILRSGIARSHDNSARNSEEPPPYIPTVVQESQSPHISSSACYCPSFYSPILMAKKWHLTVVLMCTHDAEHLSRATEPVKGWLLCESSQGDTVGSSPPCTRPWAPRCRGQWLQTGKHGAPELPVPGNASLWTLWGHYVYEFYSK